LVSATDGNAGSPFITLSADDYRAHLVHTWRRGLSLFRKNRLRPFCLVRARQQQRGERHRASRHRMTWLQPIDGPATGSTTAINADERTGQRRWWSATGGRATHHRRDGPTRGTSSLRCQRTRHGLMRRLPFRP